MGVEGAAVTSAEAAQYRAAGWWTDTTLSECVIRNSASTPDKPAYIDFSLDSPDPTLTWSEFDRAATNLAHRLLALGVAPGDGVAVWHKDTSAIHVLLVAIERCGANAVANGELKPDDVFLPVIPTPFGFGIWTSHTTPIHLGATAVRIEKFDAAATCAAIDRYQATVLCCVSTQLAMILANPASREYDLTSLRVVFTGG